MAGDGPAADATENIYFLVGNGTFDTTLSGGFPEQVRLRQFVHEAFDGAGSSLTVADYFAMNNAKGPRRRNPAPTRISVRAARWSCPT